MNNLLSVAEEALETFDIPEHRVHINKNNLQWLLKNLSKMNSNHKRFEEIMGLLQKIEKERLYLN